MNTSLSRSIRWTAITLLLFLLVEALLFRLPWYYRYLQPMSSTGQFELNLYWLRHFRPPDVHEVLIIGDSRMAEGFSAWNATAASGDQRLYFWNCGIAGTTPRVWNYFLRDADPTRNRFRAIVIGLDRYIDEDEYDSQQNRILDLNYVVARLRIRDISDFSSSMRDPANQRTAWVGSSLKGTVMHQDLHEFLEDIPKRMREAKDGRENELLYSLGYEGRVGDLHGLSADWQARQLTFPQGVNAESQAMLEGELMPKLPAQRGEATRYRTQWLGRILEAYRNSATRIIFLEMPRGPLQAPPRNVPTLFLDQAQRQTNVTVLNASTFRDLETPETFFDALHLNRKGRNLFSLRLGDQVRAVLSHK